MNGNTGFKKLRSSLRLRVRQSIGRAAQAASARRPRGSARSGGPPPLDGYSTIATGSGGTAFTDVERAVERVLDEVLRTPAAPPGGGWGGGDVGPGGGVGSGGRGSGAGSGGSVALASYALASRQPDLQSAARTLAGLEGRISPEQVILRSQVTPLLRDIKSAAERIATAADDDADEARSLLSLITDQINGILAEVEGSDRPREPRMNGYIDSLGTSATSGLIGELSDAAEVDLAMDVVSPEDEVLLTTLTLLGKDAELVEQRWQEYLVAAAPGTDSLGEKLASASRLFPVIGDAAATMTAELGRLGFTRREAASASGDLREIDDNTLRILPDISLDRLLDWLETWSADAGPRAIAEGSRFGLERVTDEADALFFVVAGVLANVISLTAGGSAGAPRLAAVLAGERVQPILGQLAGYLSSLADLA